MSLLTAYEAVCPEKSMVQVTAKQVEASRGGSQS